MIKGAFGTRFGIALSPDTGINGIYRLPCFQGMLSEQCFDRLAIDLPLNQGIVDAAPAPLKTGSQAQMRWGKNRPSGQQCIGKPRRARRDAV